MEHVICLECPNGCHLVIDVKDRQIIQVSGNRCEKGIYFVEQLAGQRGQGGVNSLSRSPSSSISFPQELLFNARQVVPSSEDGDYGFDFFCQLTQQWGISLKRFVPDCEISGSPERSLFRVVIEDARGQCFILGRVPPRAVERKKKIAKTLAFLSAQQVPFICPYTAEKNGGYVVAFEDGFWQMMPYLRGQKLDREQYLHDKWRAAPLAYFLKELCRKTGGQTICRGEEVFSIKKYIYDLVRQISLYQPALMDDVDRVLGFLEGRFMAAHDQFPVQFCHGDFHPLNIIWGKDTVRAVIDWEFIGLKPQIYDAANMVGCLGIEHPSSLIGELVVTFLEDLRSAKIFSDFSWEHFAGFVLALRFAWLSEWLRKDDAEMVELELVYMKLLMESQEKLKVVWGLGKGKD